MSKTGELLKNTLILGLGQMTTMLISLILLPLYTVYLSPSEYGFIDLFITYIALLIPIMTIQLDRSAFRYLVEARDDNTEKLKIISTTLFTVSYVVALFVIFYLIAGLIFNIQYFSIIPITIVSAVYSGIFMQIARGLGRNSVFAKGSIVSGLTTLVATLSLVVWQKLGIPGMLISITLSNVVSASYVFFALKLHKLIKYSAQDRSINREMIKYSLPLVPSVLSWWVINVSDRSIITLFLGFAANGIYAVANKYALIFMAIYSVFDMSWTESAALHINNKDRNNFFTTIFNTNIRLFGSLGAILIAFMSILFPVITAEQFSESYKYIPILITAAVFNSIVAMFSVVYIAKKLTRKVLATSLLAALINIIINLALIKYIGIYSAAISTFCAFLAMALFRGYDIQKYVSIKYNTSVIVWLSLLYALVITLYYINTDLLNIISTIIVLVSAFVLNRTLIQAIIRKSKYSLRLKFKSQFAQ
jgi:O-antigen/teichoic acid export membrane protein